MSISSALHLPIPPGWRKRPLELRFDVEGIDALTKSPELLATCHLLPSMRMGLPLRVPRNFSPRLRENLPNLVTRLAQWADELQEIEIIDAPESGERSPVREGRMVASCFTGGVDSFFTLLTRREEIDAVVYVLGFDLNESNATLWSQVHEMLKTVCERMGKKLIIVRTNLRQLLDGAEKWGMTHGTALAAIGHALSGSVQRLIIPSSFGYGGEIPWGSHPLLDPLWSSEDVEIEHDSTAHTRVAKLKRIMEDEIAREYLRVCWENPDEVYNCGRCEKCFRTMAGLIGLGELERAKTFPKMIHPELVARMDLGGDVTGTNYLDVRDELLESGRDPELLAFIERIPGLQRLGPVPSSALVAANRTAHTPLIVRKAEVTVAANSTRVVVPVEWGQISTKLEVEFDLGGKDVDSAGDAILAWFLPVAMFHRVPLVIEDPVAEELLASLPRLQLVLSNHIAFTPLKTIEVTATSRAVASVDESLPWASAFSSGVDAMFTAVTEDRSKFLVWIDGIDTEAFDSDFRAQREAWVREGAEAVGKPLVTVRANIRGVLFRQLGLHWGFMYVFSKFGLAHLLSAHFSRFLIASERDYREMIAFHRVMVYTPLVTRELSREGMRIVIHGQAKNRWQRIETLAARPEILNKLMVCSLPHITGYAEMRNCGDCEKCRRTLTAIRLAGGAHPAESFAAELDLEKLSKSGGGDTLYAFYPQMLAECERRGSDPELTAALRGPVERLNQREHPEGESGAWEALRAHPDWTALRQRHARTLAQAATSDKPSARLAEALKSDPHPEFRGQVLDALLKGTSRAKLRRWAFRALFQNPSKP